MKKIRNEQTNSSTIPLIAMSDSPTPIYSHKNEDLDFKSNDHDSNPKVKIKVYHPKMMIAYKAL